MLQRLKKILWNTYVRTGALSLLAWFVLHTLIISYIGLHDDVEKADCIVVFGNRVYTDGSLSARLKARVDKAIDLYREGYSRTIMASGSIQEKDKVREGTAMKAYLIENGVRPADIIADDFGTNSYLTTVNYKALAQKNHYRSVIVVSEFYHIARIKMTFRKMGILPVHAAHANYYEWNDIPVLLREFMAFYKYLVWY